MQELVESLISKQCEGVWWDFKQKFPSELIDMLHDITCLANVIHDGDRYLVYGVTDDYEVVGLNEGDNHHTQADVINYLRQQPYAENCEPQISLTDVEYEGKAIAILTVKNMRLKPYYFTKDIRKGKHFLRAGAIYSRVGDTNTPKDSCANPKDAEAMWHERFGLGLRPDERFSVILEDTENWKYNGIDGAYYILDPDYRIEIGEKESTKGNYWWQFELVEKPVMFTYLLKFKDTTLHEFPGVRFQNEQLCIPFPDIKFIIQPEHKPPLERSFYCDLFYYEKGTLKYSLYSHLRKMESDAPRLAPPIRSQIRRSIISLPFFIADDQGEVDFLCKKLAEAYDEFTSNFHSIIADSIYQGSVSSRNQIERVFSEWVFSRITGKTI